MVGGWINPLLTLPQGLVLTFDVDPDPDPELDNYEIDAFRNVYLSI